MAVEEWLARRDRNRKIRAEMAARRAVGKSRRHVQRLEQARSAVVNGEATESPGEGNGMPPTVLACDGTTQTPAR